MTQFHIDDGDFEALPPPRFALADAQTKLPLGNGNQPFIHAKYEMPEGEPADLRFYHGEERSSRPTVRNTNSSGTETKNPIPVMRSSPMRIASPSPARTNNLRQVNLSQDAEPKLDFDKVRQKAAKKKKNKKLHTPIPQAIHTIRGFHTPGTSCGEESDISAVSTPILAPKWSDFSSAASSPAMRPSTPSTPPSGIGALRLQMEALSTCGSTPKLSATRVTGQQGLGSSSGSDGDRAEMDSYEVQLEHDFVSQDATSKPADVGVKEDRQPSFLNRKMTAADFDPLTCLGKGAFGTVILVKQRGTGRLFAQKQLKKASVVVRKRLVEQTKTERAILESVNRHPFVVKLYYAFQDQEKLYLILEYAQGGELFHHLSMERMFNQDTAAFYLAEMVLALEHLHHNVGVVYRDLKPENILLDAEGHLLLTDFGLSKVAVDDAEKCNSFLGTIPYMAPEVLLGKEYNMSVDWWSFGILACELLTGSPPFTGNNNAKVQEKIIKSKPQLPYYIGPDAKDMIVRFLRKDPKKRLGSNMPRDLTMIKTHRFFRGITWKKLAKRELDPPIKPVITNPELAENFAQEFTELAVSPTVLKRPLVDGFELDMDEQPDLFGGFSYVASSSLLDHDCVF